jgi:hypothetical protein
MSSQLSSTWPVINNEGLGVQASGFSNGRGYGSNVRGQLPNGMAVVVDANCLLTFDTGPTCDHIYVVPSLECHLWEQAGQPTYVRAEQPNIAALGILLVVYGYMAYTFQRYPAGAMGKVTGLTAPTF